MFCFLSVCLLFVFLQCASPEWKEREELSCLSDLFRGGSIGRSDLKGRWSTAAATRTAGADDGVRSSRNVWVAFELRIDPGEKVGLGRWGAAGGGASTRCSRSRCRCWFEVLVCMIHQMSRRMGRVG